MSDDHDSNPPTLWLLVPALAFVILQLWAATFEPYDLLHDEAYYWVGAQRLSFGYVDHPPLAPWVLAVAVALLGDGRLVFAFVPALCGAATIVVTARIAQRLGAGNYGQLLAGLCVATAPFFLVFFSFFSVNALAILFWALSALTLVEIIRTENPRLWLLLGAIAGVALLNKHTYTLIAGALAMAILLSPQRRHLATRWPWLAALLALAIASPNLLWNFQHDWPSLQFYQHRSGINVPTNPLEALVMQIGGAGPAAVLVWLPGLIYLMRSPAMKAYRPLGIAFALLLFVMLLSGLRRGDRIAGAYPIVFAAGAAFIDGGSGRWVRALRWLAPALMLVLAVPTARLSLPIRPPEKIAAFFDSIGQKPSIESVEELALPIHLSARLEWQRFADQVIAAYESLPPHQRARTAILTPHWLYASVIEYYGRERNLPPVVSPHNAYYFWRGAAAGRDVVLAVAIDPEALALYFAKNTPLDVFECEYCVSWRPNLPIVLAEGAEQPLVEYLEEWRHFGLDMSPLLTIDRPPSISLLEPQNDWRHLARSGSIYGS